MNVLGKILLGALMVVVGVFSSVTFFSELVTMVKAAIGPILVLVGAFLIWLETDEWKLQREQQKTKESGQGLQREFRPQKATSEKTGNQASENYDQLLSGTVEEVKDAVREMNNPDYRAILEAEKQGKDRKTVKDFLKRRLD